MHHFRRKNTFNNLLKILKFKVKVQLKFCVLLSLSA